MKFKFNLPSEGGAPKARNKHARISPIVIRPNACIVGVYSRSETRIFLVDISSPSSNKSTISNPSIFSSSNNAFPFSFSFSYHAPLPPYQIPSKQKIYKPPVENPPMHFQPGSLHVSCEVYKRMTLPVPEGVRESTPWGSSIVLVNPWKRIVLTRDTLDMIDGDDSPLFPFYANEPDGIYVPDSACIEQKKVPVKGTLEVKTLTGEISEKLKQRMRRERVEGVMLTIQPMHDVIVVGRGRVKSVIVTPQSFLFEGTHSGHDRRHIANIYYL
ncbi:hypothetical protein BDQ17DRAFT_1365488 [Cyathus striatus]|nr:hypothetical protein BDQ17DRAFT_1365488 [Cyathus striatus]